MAKAKEEEKKNGTFVAPIIEDDGFDEIEVPKKQIDAAPQQREQVRHINGSRPLVNCLKNEKIIVRFIPRQRGMVSDPKHVAYGGMMENAKRVFTVPLLRSGAFVDVLNKDEKAFLEYTLGLEDNAMSVYNRNNNFWSTANERGVSKVELHKSDNYLDLSNPIDYIKYKILLANKDIIAPNLQSLQDQPKASYEFVIISESEKSRAATTRVNAKKLCYKALGKIENDIDTLRLVVETIDGRPTAASVSLEALQVKADDLINASAGTFLKVVSDPLLPTKVLIRKGIEHNLIARRGNYLYNKEDNTPLCENGQEPTLNIAATYLNNPKHQELKFSLEAKLKN